jgi:glutamyl-tRNA reductase
MIAFEIELKAPAEREAVVSELAARSSSPLLVLNTCQRLECFGLAEPRHASTLVTRTWKARDAFERLARIAAGLESRILGELEVLGQVRNAYKQFNRLADSEVELDRVFQQALALARKARRESEIDSELTSLSGLAARTLLDRVPAGTPLAVIGSGSLASSVTRYLGKRGKSPIRVSSRCPDKALTLALEVGGYAAGLDGLSTLLEGVGGIISATAAPHPVVYPRHIEKTSAPLHIVDLGVPADCADTVRTLDHVAYTSLEDIETLAQVNTEERRRRAEIAAQIIKDGADAWSTSR